MIRQEPAGLQDDAAHSLARGRCRELFPGVGVSECRLRRTEDPVFEHRPHGRAASTGPRSDQGGDLQASSEQERRAIERFYCLPAAPLPSTTAVPDVSPKAAAVTVVPPVPATTVVPPVPATVPAPVPETTEPQPKQSQSEKDSSSEDSESSEGEDVEK